MTNFSNTDPNDQITHSTPISTVSPPAVVTLTNGPAFNPYLCPQFAISNPSSLIPLTTSLSTPTNTSILNAISSSSPFLASNHITPTSAADTPLPESPPLPLKSPHNSAEPRNDTRKRNKSFSIAAILASVRGENEEETTEKTESLVDVTGPPVSPKPILTGRKRRKSRVDETEEDATPAKSAKPTPLLEIPPSFFPAPHLLASNSNQAMLNLPLAADSSDECAAPPTSSSTDSGINVSSSSGTSTPSSIPTNSIHTASLASQLVARVGAEHAHIQHMKRALSLKWHAMTIASPDEDGDTLLHLAIASEKPDLVSRYIKVLASHGFKLDLKNHLRQTPLHVAVITNQPVIIRNLIAAGADVNVCDRNGDTAIHLACKWGDETTLKAICESKNPKPNLNAKNFNGLAAIHLASINNKSECIKVLIDSGAEKNIGDGTSGKTALHHSIEGKHFSLITLLVQYDLDVNIPTFSGITPLQFASGLQEQEIVSYLIHNGTVATKHMSAVQPQDRVTNRVGPQQPEPTSSTVRQSPVNLT